MRQCPYCGHANLDTDTQCRKCDASLVGAGGTVYRGRRHWIRPETAYAVRSKGLAILVLGLLIKVYWGGYGPWPVMDNPTLANLRSWLEPLLLYGGAALYAMGWVLRLV